MNTENKPAGSSIDTSIEDEQTTLMKFPCEFPLKIMGKNHASFTQEMCQLVEDFISHTIEFDSIMTRPSRSGKYTALTITITAESKDQLDKIYRALYEHDDVSMTL